VGRRHYQMIVTVKSISSATTAVMQPKLWEPYANNWSLSVAVQIAFRSIHTHNAKLSLQQAVEAYRVVRF
jgi:hypothetical protein